MTTLFDTPVAVIQGARQVGKSTLVSLVAEKINCMKITLDDTTMLNAAKTDPLAFVNQYPGGTLAIDEVQLCPELLRAVKLSVDENRRPGRFLLTGSADLLHVAGANESLAGRAETIKLYPFSQGEMEGRKEDFISSILRANLAGLLDTLQGAPALTREDYAARVAMGGYPDIVLKDSKRRNAWFRNYIMSVLDHDAADLSGLSHLDKLGVLFSVISGQTSSEFVQRSVAGMTGIPESSLSGYVRLLKDLYLVLELSAWGRNLSRRVVSKKKISLTDSGVASHLNGLSETALADVLRGEAFGAVLESFVVAELFKQQSWSAEDFTLYHYRDRDRKEVDLVVELFDGRIVALEVKAARTVSRSDFAGMKTLRETAGDRFLCGIVLYTGANALPYGNDMFAAPISAVWGS
ncbi:MAG: ATP-binding protein [Clostridiales Family XIII bacterium]|nr:ATP-binding protein [Clostridiales Family XIII bacterium]